MKLYVVVIDSKQPAMLAERVGAEFRDMRSAVRFFAVQFPSADVIYARVDSPMQMVGVAWGAEDLAKLRAEREPVNQRNPGRFASEAERRRYAYTEEQRQRARVALGIIPEAPKCNHVLAPLDPVCIHCEADMRNVDTRESNCFGTRIPGAPSPEERRETEVLKRAEDIVPADTRWTCSECGLPSGSRCSDCERTFSNSRLLADI